MGNEDLSRRIMFTVHSGLPREAPGSRESTAIAQALIDAMDAHEPVVTEWARRDDCCCRWSGHYGYLFVVARKGG
jgi:hypothetical protein